MSRKSALVTGVTGQDGSYLADLLLEKGYDVHGMVRRASTEKFDRIEHLRGRITLYQGDLLDQRSLVDALRAAQPTEIEGRCAPLQPGQQPRQLLRAPRGHQQPHPAALKGHRRARHQVPERPYARPRRHLQHVETHARDQP